MIAMGPPDEESARRQPGALHDTQPDAHRTEAQGTAPSPRWPVEAVAFGIDVYPPEHRCRGRQPCEDVLAFVRGAERARDVDVVDDARRDEVADILRHRAEQIAEAHHYGQEAS
jgi:hypothetical protein